MFILKNKSTGAIKTVDVKLDYELAEACVKTCEQINAHIKANTLPDRIKDVEVCAKCNMRTACCPGMNFGVELVIADDAGFEARLDEYTSLKPDAKKCDDVYEVIKTRVKATAKGQPFKITVGKYLLEGKPDSRGAMRFDIEKM